MKRKICEWLTHSVMAIGVITMLCCVNEEGPLTTFFTLLVGAGLYFGAEIIDSYIHYLKGENK